MIYICIYVYICICIHTQTCIHICIHIHIKTYRRNIDNQQGIRYALYVYMYIYIYIHSHVSIYIYIYTHIKTYRRNIGNHKVFAMRSMCICIYIYIYTFTCLYVYIYLHTCKDIPEKYRQPQGLLSAQGTLAPIPLPPEKKKIKRLYYIIDLCIVFKESFLLYVYIYIYL